MVECKIVADLMDIKKAFGYLRCVPEWKKKLHTVLHAKEAIMINEIVLEFRMNFVVVVVEIFVQRY